MEIHQAQHSPTKQRQWQSAAVVVLKIVLITGVLVCTWIYLLPLRPGISYAPIDSSGITQLANPGLVPHFRFGPLGEWSRHVVNGLDIDFLHRVESGKVQDAIQRKLQLLEFADNTHRHFLSELPSGVRMYAVENKAMTNIVGDGSIDQFLPVSLRTSADYALYKKLGIPHLLAIQTTDLRGILTWVKQSKPSSDGKTVLRPDMGSMFVVDTGEQTHCIEIAFPKDIDPSQLSQFLASDEDGWPQFLPRIAGVSSLLTVEMAPDTFTIFGSMSLPDQALVWEQVGQSFVEAGWQDLSNQQDDLVEQMRYYSSGQGQASVSLVLGSTATSFMIINAQQEKDKGS